MTNTLTMRKSNPFRRFMWESLIGWPSLVSLALFLLAYVLQQMGKEHSGSHVPENLLDRESWIYVVALAGSWPFQYLHLRRYALKNGIEGELLQAARRSFRRGKKVPSKAAWAWLSGTAVFLQMFGIVQFVPHALLGPAVSGYDIIFSWMSFHVLTTAALVGVINYNLTIRGEMHV